MLDIAVRRHHPQRLGEWIAGVGYTMQEFPPENMAAALGEGARFPVRESAAAEPPADGTGISQKV